MNTILEWLAVQSHRRAIYSTSVILLPVLTGASLLSDGQAQKVLAVLALLAGVGVPGLARRHTAKPEAPGQGGHSSAELLLLIVAAVGVVLILCGVRFH